MMITMNKELFQQHTEGKCPTLVEFWAPWCGYCTKIAAAMEKVAEGYRGLVKVGQINIDDHPLMAAAEQIEVIPTLILYRDGKVLGSIVAPESRMVIEDFIDRTMLIE